MATWSSSTRARLSRLLKLLPIESIKTYWAILRSEWNRIEWPLVIGFGVACIVIGYRGFSIYYSQKGIPCSFWDCLYQSLLLFSMQAGFEPGETLPLALQFARFAAPAVAAYTFIQALKEIFKEQMLLITLWRTSGHYIVCGLGQKGLLLTKELRRQGQRVVVIEQDSANPNLKVCQEMGAIVLIGDARDPLVLNKARVQRATHLISVCSEDGTNAEVAEQTRALVEEHCKQGFTCHIHIIDTYLWTLLREREFATEDTRGFRLNLFNVYDSGARILLREDFGINKLMHCRDHLLIVGMGELAENLIIHAAQYWCITAPVENERITISIVDPDVEHKLEALIIRYPLLEKACNFIRYAFPPDGSEFYTAEFMKTTPEVSPAKPVVTHAYVCLDDTSLGLRSGFILLQRLGNQKVQIMVRMSEDAGLAAFLRGVKSPGTAFTNLKAFGLLDRTCKVELFDDGTHESLARVIHQNYVEQERQKKRPAEKNTSLVSWEELPEELRESNRNQANHIGIKLNRIGCGVMPWRAYDAVKRGSEAIEKETEVMARMEHERWMMEKRAQGYQGEQPGEWNYHPDLCDWDDGLSEEAKEKTRQTVRLIPGLLAQAGFQIYRREE